MNIKDYIHNVTIQTMKRGTVIFREGDASNNCMYFLFDGQIDFIKRIDNQNKIVNSQYGGSFFGEMALVKNSPRAASAIVSSDYIKLATLNKDVFMKISRVSPEFLFELLKISIERTIMAENRLNEYIKKMKEEGDI